MNNTVVLRRLYLVLFRATRLFSWFYTIIMIWAALFQSGFFVCCVCNNIADMVRLRQSGLHQAIKSPAVYTAGQIFLCLNIRALILFYTMCYTVPAVGSERKGRQTNSVIQVACRVIGPRIAHGYGEFYLVTAHHYAVTFNLCRGPMPYMIRPCYGKSCHRLSVVSL